MCNTVCMSSHVCACMELEAYHLQGINSHLILITCNLVLTVSKCRDLSIQVAGYCCFCLIKHKYLVRLVRCKGWVRCRYRLPASRDLVAKSRAENGLVLKLNTPIFFMQFLAQISHAKKKSEEKKNIGWKSDIK